jgi:drug/metabolite transporter (DMT)-like permease
MHATLFGVTAALLTALCQTATDIGTKAATREAEERLTLAAQWTVGAVFLSLLCLVWYPSILLQPAATFAALTRPGFWPLLLLDGVLNVIAYYFFVRAFRLSDASLVAPLMLVTPVLLLVTSPLILSEHVPPIGALGVVFAVLGSAFLGGSDPSASLHTSFIVFARDYGVRSMFVTAVIWSITSNLDKLGVRASTPLLWTATITTFIALCSIIFWLAMPHRPLRLRDTRYAVLSGMANAIGNALLMYALTLLFVPYVIAIKRMSALFTVIASGIILKENNRGRIVGTVIMLVGTVFIAFAR